MTGGSARLPVTAALDCGRSSLTTDRNFFPRNRTRLRTAPHTAWKSVVQPRPIRESGGRIMARRSLEKGFCHDANNVTLLYNESYRSCYLQWRNSEQRFIWVTRRSLLSFLGCGIRWQLRCVWWSLIHALGVCWRHIVSPRFLDAMYIDFVTYLLTYFREYRHTETELNQLNGPTINTN